jgi:RNA polymerase sigma-70 factor, ECF subfamily
VDADDRRLVARCLAGDEDACRELVQAHARLVGTLIWRATGDDAVVEDLAQETFMRVFRALALFEGQAKLSTWICTIAHRVAIDHVRKAARSREDALTVDEQQLDALLAQAEAAAGTPETLASTGEIARLVQRCVRELPDKYRLPLVYASIDGLDYATIGSMLGVPIGTVKTLVFRGKQLLRLRVEAALARPNPMVSNGS